MIAEVHNLSQSVLEALIPVAVTFVTGLSTIALNELRKYLKNKAGIELRESTRFELDLIARDAIAYAEERARLLIKNGGKVSHDLKKDIALEFAMASKKAKEAGPARVERIILAQLGATRKPEIE